jgi:hypothetical protein
MSEARAILQRNRPFVHASLRPAGAHSNSLVYKSREKSGRGDELGPFCIECGGGFRRYGLVQRLSLSLERPDILADGDEHVAIVLKPRPVADRMIVPGDHAGWRRQLGSIRRCSARRIIMAARSRRASSARFSWAAIAFSISACLRRRVVRTCGSAMMPPRIRGNLALGRSWLGFLPSVHDP